MGCMGKGYTRKGVYGVYGKGVYREGAYGEGEGVYEEGVYGKVVAKGRGVWEWGVVYRAGVLLLCPCRGILHNMCKSVT